MDTINSALENFRSDILLDSGSSNIRLICILQVLYASLFTTFIVACDIKPNAPRNHTCI